MDKNKIKAPEYLKHRTIKMMEAEINSPRKIKSKILKPLISVAAMLVIFIFTGFAHNYFSGTEGDDLAFTNAEYVGGGIVYLDVENRAKKDLQFKKAILKTWKTNEELVYINEKGDKDLPLVNVEMPLIKAGEKARIVIDLSSIDYKKLEEPIDEDDWFYLLLTNSDFEHGRDWMASMRFNNEIIEVEEEEIDPEYKKEQARRSPKIDDNTDMDYIKEIKDKYEIKPVLDDMILTMGYNNAKNPHICLKADIGSDIYALSDGVVKEQGCAEVKGNYIIIEHSEDFSSEYYHCSEILLEKGDKLKAGDVIAKVGTTGRSTGPHLALSTKYKDEFINPLHLYDEEQVKKLK